MRPVIVLFISGLTGLVLNRCASPQLRREIVEAQVENAEAVAVVQKYIPAGAERQRVERALSRSSELLEKTEAARTEAETTAAEAQADASKWRWLKGLAIAGGVAALAFGAFRLFR